MGKSWTERGDTVRQKLAGTKLPFKGALVQLRCDWMELAGTLGFPSWSSGSHPCMLCSISKKQLQQHVVQPLPLESFAWPLKGWKGYCDACSTCEQVLNDPSTELMTKVRKLLRSDHRGGGSQGLTMTASLAHGVLLKGDRVEPVDGGVGDWQQLYEESPLTKLCFWRVKKETMTKHRNPLFDSAIGTDIWNIMAVDCMHTWFLGIMQQFLAALLWELIKCNISKSTSSAAENRHQENMAELNRQLQSFYKLTEKRNPENKLSKMELRMEMIGKQESPELSAKAAETMGLLQFMGFLLPTLGGQWSRAETWTEAAKNLWKLWLTCKSQPLVMDTVAREDRGRHM